VINATNQYLPGAVPTDLNQRNMVLNYQRDSSIPKHMVKWNWILDVPVGKGKKLLGNAGPILNRIVGGWQIAGLGSLQSTWSTFGANLSTPSTYYPTGAPLEFYGYKYPIQDCTKGTCYPAYLWYNGYIPANKINSVDPKTGKPNGYEGVPASYRPYDSPLNPWPANPDHANPSYNDYGTNYVYLPPLNGETQPKRIVYNDNLNPLRNQFFPGPREWNLDASLFKTIPIKERFTFRLNLDAFNVLNHPGNSVSGYGAPSTFIPVGTTGVMSTTASWNNPRTLQITGRLTW
jgi:hypothetical protein